MNSTDSHASAKTDGITSRDEKPASQQDTDETTCPRCGESHDLAKVKGCIKCLKCGFKFDCNGW
jgi:ribosomal protein S27AE